MIFDVETYEQFFSVMWGVALIFILFFWFRDWIKSLIYLLRPD